MLYSLRNGCDIFFVIWNCRDKTEACNDERGIVTSDGLAKKFVKHIFIFWIIVLLDLETNFIDKL